MPHHNEGRYDAIMAAPLYHLGITLTPSQQALAQIDLLPINTPLQPPQTALAQRIVQQLSHYLHNPHTPFTIPLALGGTPFQQQVWQYLQTIPCGETRTYQQLAMQMNTSPRAIGGACRRNPIPLLIPCHRVVAKTGIGGFDGQQQGMKIHFKHWLLAHETRPPML